MESRVITVGIWSAVVIYKWGLIPLQLNPLSSLHKMLNPAAGAATPGLWTGENWSLEVQSSLTWYCFVTCCLQLQQLITETSISPLKNPNPLSFTEALLAFACRCALCKLKVLCVPNSSDFLRGCPHLWKQKEVYIDHTVVRLNIWNGFFYLCFTKKVKWIIFLFPSSIVFL